MDYRKREWSEEHKKLRELLKKETTLTEMKECFMNLHAMVHSGFTKGFSFEDELWEHISDDAFRKSTNKKKRTVAYGIWHSTRIEDMTMNLLVVNGTQVIDEENWQERIGSPMYDTGNALSLEEVLEFSKDIDIEQLRNYRYEVGKRTRNIVQSLSFTEIKRKVFQSGLEKILEKGAVVRDEKAIWLIDYWKNKNTGGILLMPSTRHLLVHINESLEAKKRAR